MVDKLSCSREDFEAMCCKLANDIYGAACNKEIEYRLKDEIAIIYKKGYIAFFMLAKFVSDTAKKDGRIIGYRGLIGSSLVAYILGITDIDPIKYGLYPELLYGVNNRNLPRFIFNLPNGYRETMIKAIENEYSESKVYRVAREHPVIKDNLFFVGDIMILSDTIMDLEVPAVYTDDGFCLHPRFRNMYSSTGYVAEVQLLEHDGITMLDRLENNVAKVEIDDSDKWKKALSLFSSTNELDNAENYQLISTFEHDLGTWGIPECSNSMEDMLRTIQVSSLSDLIRAYSLNNGVGVWDDNIELLLKSTPIRDHKVPSSREEVVTLLRDSGVDIEDALGILDCIHSGNGLDNESRTILLEHGISNYIIESMELTTRYFTDSQSVEYGNMMAKLMYYKLYYPLQFYAAYYSVNVREYNAGLLAFDSKRLAERITELTLQKHKDERLFKLLDNYKVCYEMRSRGIEFAEYDNDVALDNEFMVCGDKIMPSRYFIEMDDGLPFKFA